MHQVAASSAYKGWADVDLGSSLVAHAGWKGYQICEESVGICSDNTDSESDDCLYDAMRAAGALAILTTLAGFYVLLVSLFEALQVLPGWAGVTLPDCHYLLHGCEPVLVGKLLGQGLSSCDPSPFMSRRRKSSASSHRPRIATPKKRCR
eukprot:m.58758 g.58758  ORF g.58758 m.58758 type:complete len:150 (-) comp49189_c0_seq6:186-635(-)